MHCAAQDSVNLTCSRFSLFWDEHLKCTNRTCRGVPLVALWGRRGFLFRYFINSKAIFFAKHYNRLSESIRFCLCCYLCLLQKWSLESNHRRPNHRTYLSSIFIRKCFFFTACARKFWHSAGLRYQVKADRHSNYFYEPTKHWCGRLELPKRILRLLTTGNLVLEHRKARHLKHHLSSCGETPHKILSICT